MSLRCVWLRTVAPHFLQESHCQAVGQTVGTPRVGFVGSSGMVFNLPERVSL